MRRRKFNVDLLLKRHKNYSFGEKRRRMNAVSSVK